MTESSRKTTGAAQKRSNAELVRYYNDGVIGVDVLYEAAVGGSHLAAEKLKQLADIYLDAAGDARRTEEIGRAVPRDGSRQIRVESKEK